MGVPPTRGSAVSFGARQGFYGGRKMYIPALPAVSTSQIARRVGLPRSSHREAWVDPASGEDCDRSTTHASFLASF
jgi:hypothetical protein